MNSASTDQPPVAVNVSLQELIDGSVSLETLENAFGPASLGIIIVRDLPEQFESLRKTVLSYSSYLANLPSDELGKLEVPASNYNIGWSCGKETLADGRYDTHKGSFYAQPILPDNDNLIRQDYPNLPEFTTPNVWPSQKVLPDFESAFLSLCKLIIDVAALVARSCDRYGVARLDDYRPGTLEEIVRTSVSTKARLLHYFPPGDAAPSPSASKDDSTIVDDDWCATHLDLGALTGLTSQMFVDEAVEKPVTTNGGGSSSSSIGASSAPPPLNELPSHPDPRAGLWIKDRAGRVTQVDIPRDCLAFQTGQALQAITRGRFRAVPHFVRGGSTGGAASIARNTLAVFTQPNLWDEVEPGKSFAAMAKEVLGRTV